VVEVELDDRGAEPQADLRRQRPQRVGRRVREVGRGDGGTGRDRGGHGAERDDTTELHLSAS
jgi:hypothetical protein